MEDARKHAINKFEALGSDFQPALRFQLARMYRVDNWIELAFRQLLGTDILSMTLEQMSQMGEVGFFAVVQTKAKIQKFRTELAFSGPSATNSLDCSTPANCWDAWGKEWWSGFAKLIHHPVQPLSGPELRFALEDVKIPGMCDPCQACSVSWVISKGIFEREEMFVRAAVLDIMNWQTEKAIRREIHAD